MPPPPCYLYSVLKSGMIDPECTSIDVEQHQKIMAFTLMYGVADYVIFLTTLNGVIFWLVMIISHVIVTNVDH